MLVRPASLQDPTGAPPVVAEAKAHAPERQLSGGDGRYEGPAAAKTARLRVEVVEKPANQTGFHVLPQRWVVERTVGWLGKYRRIAGRDFETNPRNGEAWLKLAMRNLLVRRLTTKVKWRNST